MNERDGLPESFHISPIKQYNPCLNARDYELIFDAIGGDSLIDMVIKDCYLLYLENDWLETILVLLKNRMRIPL